MLGKKALSTALVCAAVLLFSVAPGNAGEGSVSLGIGGSVSSSPYKGYDAQWMPFPLVSYEGERFFVRDLSVGVKLFTHENLEVSLFGGYDPTSFDASESSNRRLKRLDDRHSSAVAGLGARVMTPYGDLHAKLSGDLLGHSEGLSGVLGYSNSLEAGLLEFTLDVGTYWASANYNDYYYGVSGKESRKSGLDAYDADAGFSPYLGLTASAFFGGGWTVFCKGEVVALSEEVKDSPMVDDSFTRSLSFGVMYSF